jgi:HEAT repeat protein
MKNGENVQALLSAIAVQDDLSAEAAVALLSAADEAQLLPFLNHEDPDYIWWTARALGACGTLESVTPLLDLLQHQDAALRAVAAMALGALTQRLLVQLPDPTLLQPHLQQLTPLLADPNGMVCQVAADALAQCGEIAIPSLVDVLRFGTAQGARSRAAAALGKIGTLATAPALYHCLNDQNYLVHTYAHEALDMLGLLDTMLLVP